MAVLFLVANRQMVAISLDPFSTENPALSTIALPMWVWLMFMLFMGFALGGVATWISARPKMRAARQNQRTLKSLQKEVTALRAQVAAQPTDEDGPDTGAKPAGAELPLLKSSAA